MRVHWLAHLLGARKAGYYVRPCALETSSSAKLIIVFSQVIIIDNLSNAFTSVFHRLESMVTNYYRKTPERQPILKLYEADYRNEKMMSSILKAHERPQFELDPEGSQMPRQSNITGVIHFAAFKAVGEHQATSQILRQQCWGTHQFLLSA